MKWLQFAPRPDWAALILRLAVGGLFLVHGLGKPLALGMELVSENFLANGFPVWTNYFATGLEIVAGMMLLLGLQVRLAALMLLPVTLGIIVFHFPNGWVFFSSGGGWEYPQLILFALLAIFTLGPGRFTWPPMNTGKKN